MDSMPGRSQGAFWNAGSIAMVTGLVRSSLAHLTEATLPLAQISSSFTF